VLDASFTAARGHMHALAHELTLVKQQQQQQQQQAAPSALAHEVPARAVLAAAAPHLWLALVATLLFMWSASTLI
jgi:hypothetical protein